MKCLETDSFNWLWDMIFRTLQESSWFIASLIYTTDTFQGFYWNKNENFYRDFISIEPDNANLLSYILKYEVQKANDINEWRAFCKNSSS